jgi:hypothetical protein
MFGKLSTKELLAQTRKLDLNNESSSPERLESSPGRLSLISATDEHQFIENHTSAVEPAAEQSYDEQ